MNQPKGRKPWVPQVHDILRIEKYAQLGLTQEQIAASLGISPSTWYEKRKEFPEISEVFKKGRACGIAVVAGHLQKQIEQGNVTATIFKLKCMGGWRENASDSSDNITENEASQSISERILASIRACKAVNGQ